MASWPANFPTEPALEGTGIGLLNQAPIRTEMEDGPGRARRRSTTTWSEVDLRFPFEPFLFPSFQAFLRDTLDHGAASWTMRVWKPGLSAPYPEKTVRLREDPTYEITVPYVFVTLPLLVRGY